MKFHRNKIFIDSPVQGAILRRVAAYWVLLLVSCGAFLYLIELLSSPGNAWENTLYRHLPTALTVLVFTPIFFFDLCRLTNRFAGPMHRMRRGMKDLAEGRETAPIQFRKKDYWQEMANDFNEIRAKLQAESATNVDESDSAEESEELVSV